jgi:hypothetical protein
LQLDCDKIDALNLAFSQGESIRAMLHRLTAQVLLACYAVIALAGQGLHEFLDDDGCDQVGRSIPAAVARAQSAAESQAGQTLAVRVPSGGHVHDCEHCPICQFQALGQHFVAAAPAASGLALCDILSPGHVESVYCPAQFSPAQPRAPPIA